MWGILTIPLEPAKPYINRMKTPRSPGEKYHITGTTSERQLLNKVYVGHVYCVTGTTPDTDVGAFASNSFTNALCRNGVHQINNIRRSVKE